jgi:hypothetical protein
MLCYYFYMSELTLNCPNCGEVTQDNVIFLCNQCKQEELVFKDGAYMCPACFLPGENFQCMICGSTQVTLKSPAKKGVITPVFMLAVLSIVVISFTGFILMSRWGSDTSFEPEAGALCNTGEKTDDICKGKPLNSLCGEGLFCQNFEEDAVENFNCTCSE